VKDLYFAKTRFALFWTSFFGESFLAFYGLLPFILRKDLAASAFCLSLLMTLKPAVSVLSFYWSFSTHRKPQHLKKSLLLSGLFSYLPFLFFPLFDHIWYLLFASTIFMLFSRASIPAWMEILKINLAKETREKLFSSGAIIGYLVGALLALVIGPLLDTHPSSWKILLLLSALLGMSCVWIQWKTPLRSLPSLESPKTPPFSLMQPWKEGLALLKSRRDFAQYQIGTMCNGFGIMLALPALAIFFVDHLQLSHTEMTLGRYVFMGLGYVLFSPFWAKAFGKFSIHFLTAIACIGFGLYPLFCMLALFNHFLFFFALFLYGITQAGSHLIWNLSGTIFAKEKESSPFSAMNVLTIGIRGLFAPLLGGLLCQYFPNSLVLFLAAFICFIGSWLMFKKPQEDLQTEKP
jgi:MFS family permease